MNESAPQGEHVCICERDDLPPCRSNCGVAAPIRCRGCGVTEGGFHVVTCPALAAPVAAPSVAVPPELAGVREQIEEGAGFWRPCTGCYETEDGHAVGQYPYSEVLRCTMGSGCSECGGIGAIWDDTDYDAMADFMRDGFATPPAPLLGEGGPQPSDDDPSLTELGRLSGNSCLNAAVPLPAVVQAEPEPITVAKLAKAGNRKMLPIMRALNVLGVNVTANQPLDLALIGAALSHAGCALVHPAAPQTSVPTAAPRSEPRALGQGELPVRAEMEKDAARWQWLVNSFSAGRRRIWNHVLDDEIKSDHQTLEAAIDAAMSAPGGGGRAC